MMDRVYVIMCDTDPFDVDDINGIWNLWTEALFAGWADGFFTDKNRCRRVIKRVAEEWIRKEYDVKGWKDFELYAGTILCQVNSNGLPEFDNGIKITDLSEFDNGEYDWIMIDGRWRSDCFYCMTIEHNKEED